MAILKFGPPKERAFLHVRFVRDVQERVERYRMFCGGLDLTGLVEYTLVNVVDKDANCRGREKEGAATPAKGEQRWCFGWVSPADKTGGARKFFVTPDALSR